MTLSRRDRGADPTPGWTGVERRLAHQTCDRVTATPCALGLQFRIHPRTAIGLPALVKNLLDLLGQDGILPRRLVLAALSTPGVIAAAGYPQRPTHPLDTEFVLMRTHEGLDRSGLLEKIATALITIWKSSGQCCLTL